MADAGNSKEKGKEDYNLNKIYRRHKRALAKTNEPSFFLPMEEEFIPFDPSFSMADVYMLYRSTCFHLEKWPGGDPEEQMHLEYLKTFLYRIILEAKLQQ